MPAGGVRPRPSQVPQALRQRGGAPVGVWLLATALLHAPQPVDAPYPHVCGRRVLGRPVARRECAACAEQARGDPGADAGGG